MSVQRCSLLVRGQFVCEKSNWYYLVVTNSLHTLAITARGLPKGSYTRSFFSSGDSLNESEHLSHKPGVSQKHPTPSTEVRLITLLGCSGSVSLCGSKSSTAVQCNQKHSGYSPPGPEESSGLTDSRGQTWQMFPN